jgi:hypothetical protein
VKGDLNLHLWFTYTMEHKINLWFPELDFYSNLHQLPYSLKSFRLEWLCLLYHLCIWPLYCLTTALLLMTPLVSSNFSYTNVDSKKVCKRLLILQVLTYNVLSFKMTTNRDERKAWFLQISATLFESVIFWNWCIEDSKIVDMQYIRIVNIREYICFESFLKGRTYLGTSSGII